LRVSFKKYPSKRERDGTFTNIHQADLIVKKTITINVTFQYIPLKLFLI
jgi:hypothetical protein